MKATAVHLIESYGVIAQIDKEAGIYESGNWDISSNTAQQLVGGNIFFHDEQGNPSRLGGIILKWRQVEDDPDKGRIIFTFKSQPEYKGVRTSSHGWGNGMKVVAT